MRIAEVEIDVAYGLLDYGDQPSPAASKVTALSIDRVTPPAPSWRRDGTKVRMVKVRYEEDLVKWGNEVMRPAGHEEYVAPRRLVEWAACERLRMLRDASREVCDRLTAVLDRVLGALPTTEYRSGARRARPERGGIGVALSFAEVDKLIEALS